MVVRAPLKMKEATIRDFIGEKASWIAEKQGQIAEDRKRHKPLSLADGKKALFLGQPYTIRRGGVMSIVLAGEVIRVPENETLTGFTNWLRLQAAAVIRRRVDHHAELMGLNYTSVRISEARQRWGSCGAKNTLNFAWRLIMCPPWVIDYVVVHELAHTVHRNHGPQFWSLVAAVLPEHKEARRWLKINRYLLDTVP